MPVFDFSNTTEEKKACECTYTTFQSNENTASAKYPILVLDNTAKQWKYHSCGVFMNQTKRTAFEFTQEDGTVCADILRVDARFVNLLRWLGENHINVRLSGENTPDGYAVYKIREIAFGGGKKLSAEDGFLQFMMERLFASSAPSEEAVDEEQEEDGDDMKLTSIQSITDFMTCAGRTMPDNIRLWARRNLAVARSNEVSPEERRHAQRALSIMMNIQWKNNYFEAIDPKEARRILDEELYGMERVKQRIIETIIQINRTHTLPAYGLLLVGPAGTGKSQIAYAVARILKLPWTTLDMSSINDPEQLTGSSRVYANAKPGIIMEAFSAAGESDPRRRAHAVRPPTGHMRHPVPTRRTLRRGTESRGRDPASGRMRTYRPPPNSTAPTAPADRRRRPRAPAPAVSVRSERAAASPRRMRRTAHRPRAAPTARRQAHNRRSSEVSFFQPKLRQR